MSYIYDISVASRLTVSDTLHNMGAPVYFGLRKIDYSKYIYYG